MNDLPAAGESASRLALEDFLPYRLSVLSNTISASIAAVYAERFELTIPEWRVMAVVGRQPGLSAIEVAEATMMDKVAVSRAVAKLLKTGRLEREFADQDRRRSILALSAAGNRVHAEVAQLALAYEAKLLSGLDDATVHTLSELLDKLMQQARALRPAEP